MIKEKSKILLILFIAIILVSTAVFATDSTDVTEEPEGQPVTTSETNPNLSAGTTGEGETTTTDEEVEGRDRFFTGDEIVIETLIDGNVFAIGKNVKLTGQIGGDLFVIAEKLEVEAGSSVFGNIFVTASEISINGQMYDVYATCDKLEIQYDGYIYRDLKAVGTEVTINGVVGRNAYIETDKLILDTDCLMPGNLNYKSLTDAVYRETSEDGESTNETTSIPKKNVNGEVTFTKTSKKVLKKEIKKTVEDMLKSNKINNNTSEDELREIITSYAFNITGVKSNSDIAKSNSNVMTIPNIYVYIDIVIIVALILALVLPKVIKRKGKTEKENKE